jgi:predicted 2-oxoglutarate/Fe(II)-dependent dioxygenase YbiX
MGGGDDRRFGIPVAGDSGMLVAFDSGVLHEVTEVTAGERQSVVAFCT